MLSPKVIFALLAALALIGITLLAFQWWILGGILTALGLVLLYLWWRLYQILQISDAINKNEMALARQRLDAVKNPEKLNQYSKTYYYFFNGLVEMQGNNMKGARQSFKTALETNRFRSVDERAMALVMMAQIEFRSRNNEGTRRYLREAKALEPGPQIREQISMFVKQARIRL